MHASHARVCIMHVDSVKNVRVGSREAAQACVHISRSVHTASRCEHAFLGYFS